MLTPPLVSTAKKDIIDRNEKVKILTTVKTKSKDLSKIQSNILTKIRKSKKVLTNIDLANEINKSPQTTSYNVLELVKKDLLFKNKRLIYEKKCQNIHAQSVGNAIHGLFFKMTAQSPTEKVLKKIDWSNISELNGSKNYYMKTIFNARDCKAQRFWKYGEIKLTIRIQVTKNNCYFYILLDKVPVPGGDYGIAESDYDFLAARIANHFTKTQFPSLRKMDLNIDTMARSNSQHYKICDLKDDFPVSNYKDENGLIIDKSEIKKELEHTEKAEAQFITDLPRTIKKIENKIEEKEKSHKDKLEDLVERIEKRFNDQMKLFQAQDKEAHLHHELLKRNFDINIM